MNKGQAVPRRDAIRALAGGPVDLLVVGGGIVGAGIARDAAMRGLRIGLVEQHDFAFGTSSRSSRLLHGGMRYLAQGRLGLVRQASIEKKVIHQIAPHLAEPLPFIFPTYQGDRDWVLWQLKIGVKIYDLLCGGRNLGKSTWLSADETLRRVPALLAGKLKGAVRYFDGFTNDSRLVLDTLRSAELKGAILGNYCRFKGAAPGEAWECELEDVFGGESFKVRAQAVVNATGPWGDRLQHSRVKLRITKGVHLVVERSRVPVADTVVMTEGKRILFAIPWGERTILGTTDTDYTGSLEEVRVSSEDTEYLFDVVEKFFPGARLTPQDVISAWAGLRPLIANANGKPSDISRSHQIRNPEPGWWDVAGGKLTTYRLMAEETVDQIVSHLKRSSLLKQPVTPCRTASAPLLPVEQTEGLSGILPPECSRRLVEHFCANEWALHLDDVMVRRSGWHHYRRDAKQVAARVADWLAELLGWTEETKAAELHRYERATGIESRREANPERRAAIAGRS
jgi:glycerol-3-phosphate dehydrogenase